MSDSEEEEQSEPEQEATEAEQVLKKRREAQERPAGSKGLDEAARELLESNKEDRQRMDDEIKELRLRNEKRKKEREVEEKRLAAERAAEEERRKTVEAEKKRQKEEEDEKKKKDRASKMAEFEKWKNPSKPNFVISRKSEDGSEDEGEDRPSGVAPKKSKEQQEAEKKAILHQRIVPLSADGLDAKKLADKAHELHKLIYRLEGEKYDYEKRFKAQQVDMMELAERARQANKVGRGGLKRVQVSSEDVDDVQARFSGAPAKIEMYSKYERQKDKRPYGERKDLYTGPMWGCPPERIKPKKIVKWNEEGLPLYETVDGAEPEAAKE